MRRALGEERTVVLVVEDEFLIREYAVEMINEAGFEAIEAANADEAIGFWRAVATSGSCSLTFTCRVPSTA